MVMMGGKVFGLNSRGRGPQDLQLLGPCQLRRWWGWLRGCMSVCREGSLDLLGQCLGQAHDHLKEASTSLHCRINSFDLKSKGNA